MFYNNIDVNGAPDENSMIEELKQDKLKSELCIGVVFNTIYNNSLPKNFKYKLRVCSELPIELYDEQKNGYAADTLSEYWPFTPMQMCLDEVYIKLAQPIRRFTFNMSIQQMPYPPYAKFNTKLIDGSRSVFEDVFNNVLLIVLCIEISFPTNEKHIGVNVCMPINNYCVIYLNIID